MRIFWGNKAGNARCTLGILSLIENVQGTNFQSFFLIVLLVPLYTNVLTLAEYGTIDLITVITTVLVPVITLNIHESVMRFMIDKDSDSDSILSIGLIMILIKPTYY